MDGLTDFHFIRPLWLLALIPAVTLTYLSFRHWARGSAWQRAIDPALIRFLLVKPPLSPAINPLPLLLIGWIIATLALAGPTQEKVPQPILEREDALVIILDLTWSMYAGDISPNRLVTAKRKISDLLTARDEGMTALISFAGDAHTVAPLTDDTATLLALLPALGPEIMPAPGSRLAPALVLAQDLFLDGGASSGRVLIITDEIRDRAEALSAARDLGSAYPITILAAGTESGAPIKLPESMGDSFLKDEQGNLIIPAVNAEALASFAGAIGASVAPLNLLSDDTQALLSPPAEIGETFRTIERDFDLWRELGPYLILLLAPLAIIGFRRGWLWLFTLMIMLPTEQAEASWWMDLWQTRDQQGYSEFMQDSPETAAALFEDQAWKGAALYKNKNFEEATTAFGAGDTPTHHYNLGNARAKMGDLAGALEAYQSVLSQEPEHEDALYNKALVEKLMQDQSQSESEDSEASSDGQDQNEQSGSDGSEPQEGSESQDKGEPESQQNNEQGDETEQNQDTEPESPEQNQEPETPSQQEAQAEAAEAELNPEEAQALEQWLRRVPDDPGGLLRRKFEQQFEDRVRDGEITRQDFKRNW
ncbi:MAG: VWA domain-containing protein [Pseudomonadales bacterium]